MPFESMPFDAAAVRSRLPGRRVEWFSRVDSTMTIAAQLAREGCATGTIIGADEQSAGVGRHGRSWHSEAEAGLYISMVLRLPIQAATSPVVMLALGLAVQESIAEVAGLAVDLRWPNDVLAGGRKCAGILAQLEGDAMVAGIGVNVSQTRFPDEIEALATSLLLAGANFPSPRRAREDLLVALSRAVDGCCKILSEDGPAAILRMFAQSSTYAEGRRVRVEQGSGVVEGVTCGLDASGFLVVRQDSGKETTILAGGVRPA